MNPNSGRPKTSDWGIGMTVCIAAICHVDEQREAIVTASDQMISTGHFSADNLTTKIEPVHPNWETMFSANDLSKVTPILGHVRVALKDKPAGLSQVRRAFLEAVRVERELLAEELVLAPFSLTLETFLRDGLKNLGPQDFSSLVQKIESLSLGCQFLISGFGEQGEPHILTVTDPAETSVHDLVGFWAIGSGQQSALSNMFFREYNRLLGIAPAIYHVCESKFMAETAVGVGKLTFVSIHRFGKPRCYFLQHSVDELREVWEREVKRPAPTSIYGRILRSVQCFDQVSNSLKPLSPS